MARLTRSEFFLDKNAELNLSKHGRCTIPNDVPQNMDLFLTKEFRCAGFKVLLEIWGGGGYGM